MTYQEIIQKIHQLASKQRAEINQRFFKTAKGEYGHGDLFLGVTTPQIRCLAKECTDLNLTHVKKLIKSKWHEIRLLGLIILINRYDKTKDDSAREALYNVYLEHFRYINNWDLVDVTCPHIIGKHLIDKDRSILIEWAKSDCLWTKRIAMVTNWWFIRKGDLKQVFTIAKILLHDEHDLIHKAVGWMLREAAKKDQAAVEKFLMKYASQMPRTMLRYAIERFDPKTRSSYLAIPRKRCEDQSH